MTGADWFTVACAASAWVGIGYMAWQTRAWHCRLAQLNDTIALLHSQLAEYRRADVARAWQRSWG